jgi:hypothetical protein
MKNGDSKEAEREASKAQNPKSAFLGLRKEKVHEDKVRHLSMAQRSINGSIIIPN